MGSVWFELAVVLLICLSIVILGEEWLTPVDTPAYQQLMLAQSALTAAFFVELCLRWGAAPNTRTFFRTCWLDLLAILPSLRIFRLGMAFRLLRLLRLIRILRIVAGRSQWEGGRLVRWAESATVVSIVWVALLAGTFGLAGYEHEFHFELTTLIEAFWSSIFSFFSSQYVDSYPKSVGGKIVALFVIVSGTGFFALVTGLSSAVISEKMRKGGKALSDYLLKQLDEHVVICGWNATALTALRELQLDPRFAGKEVVVISERDELSDLERLPHPERVRLINDDFTRVAVLQRANITKAVLAFILSELGTNRSQQDADARVVLAALTIEKLNPRIRSCAELANAENETHLRMGKIDEVIVSGGVAGSLMANAAISTISSRILRDVLRSDSTCNLRPRAVGPQDLGRTFGEILSEYHRKTGILPVAVAGRDGRVLLNPHEHKLEEGDELYCLEGSSSMSVPGH